VPLTYAQDVAALLTDRGIDRFATVGTSLGGIVTLLLAAMLPGRLAATVINDVGPMIEEAGLARIRGYVGQSGSHPTWIHAARAAAEANADVYPLWRIEDWLTFVKRTHRLTPEGRIVLDYDPNIAQPFKVPGGESGGDLWPAFSALKTVPTLILRGAHSDILSPATAQAMLAALDQGLLIEIPETGHAPTLDEPAARAGIAAHLAAIQ
jgi:pimeloyl-ACP methyl ester carboxylesterase